MHPCSDVHGTPRRATLLWATLIVATLLTWGMGALGATGKGAIAEAIIDKARETGVPVEENPALAEALSTLKLDETIPVDLYKAVASVIAAVLRAAKKA